MSGEPTTPVLPKGLPEDWVQTRELPCPACTYNLKMLRSPRCPECGRTFRWQQLLQVRCPRCDEALHECDANACPACRLSLNWRALLDSADQYDYQQYEYSPRPIRAALWTWLSAVRPVRFWRRISLEMPPFVPRLTRLWWAAVVLSLVGMIMLLIPANIRWSIWRRSGLGDAFCLLAPLYVLPIATGLALPRFTPTLARCRVRRDQLLRCIAYSASGLAWLGLLFGFLAVIGFVVTMAGRTGLGTGSPMMFDPYVAFGVLIGRWHLRWLAAGDFWFWFNAVILFLWVWFGLLWWWAFLYVCLRGFLRLDRINAWALLISTQAIALIILAIASQATYVGQVATSRIMRMLGIPY